MPTEVGAASTAAAAPASDEDVDVSYAENVGDTNDTKKLFQPDDGGDVADYLHLADDYKEPMFTYPSSDPSPRLQTAYEAQRLAGNTAEKLGKLHNMLRESKEREYKAKKTLRSKTITVYELELQEHWHSDNVIEFNEWLVKARAFKKKYRTFPTSIDALAMLEDDDARELTEWIQVNAHSLGPHQLAALESNLNFSARALTEEDEWHRSLAQFQLCAKKYYDTPITVQNTGGDIQRYITEEHLDSLQPWCQAQQEQYETDGFQANMDRYTELVDAGFPFDVVLNDDLWDQLVEWIEQYRNKFGHVHIPEGYMPPKCTPELASKASQLKTVIDKVRTLIHRDALSSKRRTSLMKVGLWDDMGGSVYNYHIKYCKDGRKKRREEPMIKRKFVALGAMQEKGPSNVKRPRISRNSMPNWHAKLESKFSIFSAGDCLCRNKVHS